MSEAHSKYSASAFHAAMLCPGKPVLERGKKREDTEYSAEGTAAHQLLTWCVQQSRPAAAYKGRRIPVGLRTFEVDDDMIEPVQTALDNILDAAGGGMLIADTRVAYGHLLGVSDEEAWGTLDVIAARGDELQVRDYKHGRGVEVEVEENPQLILYAAGALAQVDEVLGPFKTVRLFIDQPRVAKAPKEWAISVEELRAYAGPFTSAVRSRQAAETTYREGDEEWETTFLRPGEKQCKFCTAKATCPALRAEVADTVFGYPPATADEFEDNKPVGPAHESGADWLAASLSKVDLIEDWCKAVRTEVERRLLAGAAVPGFKLVEGRQGNRDWADAKAAEKYLRETVRLPVEKAYDLKLINPTSAEKLAKAGDIGPRQWKTLQENVTRAAPAKHVAPTSDPRPALVITLTVDDFDVVAEAEAPAIA